MIVKITEHHKSGIILKLVSEYQDERQMLLTPYELKLLRKEIEKFFKKDKYHEQNF